MNVPRQGDDRADHTSMDEVHTWLARQATVALKAAVARDNDEVIRVIHAMVARDECAMEILLLTWIDQTAQVCSWPLSRASVPPEIEFRDGDTDTVLAEPEVPEEIAAGMRWTAQLIAARLRRDSAMFYALLSVVAEDEELLDWLQVLLDCCATNIRRRQALRHYIYPN